MNTLLIILIALIVCIILSALFLVTQYNTLVKRRNRYRNGFAQIEVQLKRRYDLIPNLIETAKAYMAHEKETLEAVISARNVAHKACGKTGGSAKSNEVQDLAKADSGLNRAMGQFWSLSESYPDLRSNQNMMQLGEELTSTENKVAFARQAYNDSVTAYNTSLESFPTNILAGFFSFTKATLFEVADASERQAVAVKF